MDTTAENPLMESSEEQTLATEIEGLLAQVRTHSSIHF